MTVPPNTHIDYLYRDSGNFKAFGQVVVVGQITFHEVKPFLDQERYFSPEMVGFPRLSIEGHPFDSDLDHDWCELEERDFKPTEEAPTLDVHARSLLELFRAGAFGGWVRE